jgi:Cu+-exporting ATPase
MIGIEKENIFDTVSTKGKQEIVEKLKKDYKVMMVGNGPNDVLAFESADLAILTTEQEEPIPQKVIASADIVINKITEILAIDF